MISVFVKERHPYKKEDLISIFHSNTNACIKKLKEYGIIKTIKSEGLNTDLSELEDFEVIVDEDDTETERRYVFTFVGVIIVKGYVLKCYPKYIFDNDAPFDELSQIIKVLEKFNAKEQLIKMYVNNQEDNEFNRLAAIIYLLLDYYENGVYNNTKDVLETNGNGEINWNRTVNESFAVLCNGKPYYTELQTLKRLDDNFDYIKRLHEYVLTICSNELSESSLLDLFGLMSVELSEETMDDFGDKDYILYQLEKEINVQFNTRKIALLKTLYMFINDDGSLVDNSTLSLYGTNSFHVVWEKVCASVLDNKLEKTLQALSLPLPLHDDYIPFGNKRLIDIIDYPEWIDTTNESHKAKKTLVPDLIAIKNSNFYIFDAKYYNLILENGKQLSGNPGVGDVTKQYLYQLAYKRFIECQGFQTVKNSFLMPTENNEIIKKGSVRIKMLSYLSLEDIQIRLLPATMVYNYYLSNQKIDLDILEL